MCPRGHRRVDGTVGRDGPHVRAASAPVPFALHPDVHGMKQVAVLKQAVFGPSQKVFRAGDELFAVDFRVPFRPRPLKGRIDVEARKPQILNEKLYVLKEMRQGFGNDGPLGVAFRKSLLPPFERLHERVEGTAALGVVHSLHPVE